MERVTKAFEQWGFLEPVKITPIKKETTLNFKIRPAAGLEFQEALARVRQQLESWVREGLLKPHSRKNIPFFNLEQAFRIGFYPEGRSSGS